MQGQLDMAKNQWSKKCALQFFQIGNRLKYNNLEVKQYRSAVGSADWIRLHGDYIGIVAVELVAVAAVAQPNTRGRGGARGGEGGRGGRGGRGGGPGTKIYDKKER
jgi:hypothetical protein